jgi:hypothetical protein
MLAFTPRISRPSAIQFTVDNLRLTIQFEATGSYTESYQPRSVLGILPAGHEIAEADEDDTETTTIRESSQSNDQFDSSQVIRSTELGLNVKLQSLIMVWSFERELESSRVYERTKLDECHVSFTTLIVRTHARSIFTGVSLSDISVVIAIVLPYFRRKSQTVCGPQLHWSLAPEALPRMCPLHQTQTHSNLFLRSLGKPFRVPSGRVPRRPYWPFPTSGPSELSEPKLLSIGASLV